MNKLIFTLLCVVTFIAMSQVDVASFEAEILELDDVIDSIRTLEAQVEAVDCPRPPTSFSSIDTMTAYLSHDAYQADGATPLGGLFMSANPGWTRPTHSKITPGKITFSILWKPSEKSIIVAFRGTDSGTDVLQDIYMETDGLTQTSAGAVNTNVDKLVKQYFLPAMKQVLDQVNSADQAYWKVIVTGHSKGGSEAIVAAYHLKTEYPSFKYVLRTFGSARAGNAAFSSWINARIPDNRAYQAYCTAEFTNMITGWFGNDDQQCGVDKVTLLPKTGNSVSIGNVAPIHSVAIGSDFACHSMLKVYVAAILAKGK